MAIRFKIEGQYSMRVVKKKSLLAFFSFVDTETGLECFDWRLMKGTNGVFIGPPSRAFPELFTRFVALPDKAATALVLWTVHAYAHDMSVISPIGEGAFEIVHGNAFEKATGLALENAP